VFVLGSFKIGSHKLFPWGLLIPAFLSS
jgi:hypothetical protein